jgi:hypothetical protein
MYLRPLDPRLDSLILGDSRVTVRAVAPWLETVRSLAIMHVHPTSRNDRMKMNVCVYIFTI